MPVVQVAVYKDPSGEVQKFSGLCPHLGCLLQVRVSARVSQAA